MVVSIIIANFMVSRVLIDQGASLISCIGKPSKDSRSHPTLSTLTLVHSWVSQVREARPEATWT